MHQRGQTGAVVQHAAPPFSTECSVALGLWMSAYGSHLQLMVELGIWGRHAEQRCGLDDLQRFTQTIGVK